MSVEEVSTESRNSCIGNKSEVAAGIVKIVDVVERVAMEDTFKSEDVGCCYCSFIGIDYGVFANEVESLAMQVPLLAPTIAWNGYNVWYVCFHVACIVEVDSSVVSLLCVRLNPEVFA